MTNGRDTAFAVVTSAISDADAGVAEAESALGRPVAVWARGDEWLLAFGTALQLDFSGPTRISDAAEAWRSLLTGAQIDDRVGLSGTGLVGFGTFAFSDNSAVASVLIVPSLIIGKRAGGAFRTQITAPQALPSTASAAGTVGHGRHTRLTAGTSEMDASSYRTAVADAVARIRRGEIEKVVLARDLVAHGPQGFDLEGPLRILRARYRDAWIFAVDNFFGASPETLVASDGSAVTARVLAGTASREVDPAADSAARDALVASPKNRFEHALAVDSLMLTLGPHVDDLVVERPFALGLPNVWHLATDVTARLADGSSALDLVAALHPTAAVAGVPRREALAVIDALEPFDRGRYAGPVGWVGANGAGEWAIGLRSAQLHADGGIQAFAGAGIVAQSDPATEFSETGWKFAPVREALGLE